MFLFVKFVARSVLRVAANLPFPLKFLGVFFLYFPLKLRSLLRFGVMRSKTTRSARGCVCWLFFLCSFGPAPSMGMMKSGVLHISRSTAPPGVRKRISERDRMGRGSGGSGGGGGGAVTGRGGGGRGRGRR